MSFGSIKDNRVKLVPSKELLSFLNKHIDLATEVPQNISKSMKQCGFDISAKVEIIDDERKMSKLQSNKINFKQVRELCENIKEDCSHDNLKPKVFEESTQKEYATNTTYLYLKDLHWLNNFFSQLRAEKEVKCYLHEFITSCDLILPENEVIERNPVLEARCQKLREEQQNREYRKMTKNVDAVLKNYPEDTIAYQMKAINGQIIAVLQFVFSVVAGFVFGFLGVELIIGNLDFGFRLLLGIMCALIIALAEIYFLAKKLNEIDDATSAMPSTPSKISKQHMD